jgi:hypothetical protein
MSFYTFHIMSCELIFKSFGVLEKINVYAQCTARSA